MMLMMLFNQVGAQFWSAYMGCESQDKDAVQLFLEQVPHVVSCILLTIIKIIMLKVDLVKQLVSFYPNDLAFATTADQIDQAFASGECVGFLIMAMMMVMKIRSNCKPCWGRVGPCHWEQSCHTEDTLQVGPRW